MMIWELIITVGILRIDTKKSYDDNESYDHTENYDDYENDYLPTLIQELVTVGMLRSPELPPPPAWNDDDKTNTSDVTFQSCFVSIVIIIIIDDH